MNENQIFTSAASLVEEFLGLQRKRMIFIGGLPRSGTSSCESLLHAQEGCFVFDEFHPLLSGDFLMQLRRDRLYAKSQLDIWADSAGLDWRNFSRRDYLNANLFVFLVTLAAYTKKSKFKEKDPGKLSLLATKLPFIEETYLQIREELLYYGIETHFVYCVREPVASLSSNWQMPWISSIDPEEFAIEYLKDLNRSLSAMENIPSHESSVWMTPQSREFPNEGDVGFDQKVRSWIGDFSNRPVYSDEWPIERRHLRKLPEHVIRDFSDSNVVRRFREKFGFVARAGF